jgi:hypothetical protein
MTSFQGSTILRRSTHSNFFFHAVLTDNELCPPVMHPMFIHLLALRLRRNFRSEPPHPLACIVARSLVKRIVVSCQFCHSKASTRHVRNVYTDKIIFLDKENGQKMTLPQLLKERSEELSTAFGDLSNEEKQDLLTTHLNLKEERDNAPRRLTNVAVSKAVSAKMNIIINLVLYNLRHLPNTTLSAL